MERSGNGSSSSLVRSPRIGLAIAAGAPEGAVYEIGALRALDESLDGVDFNNAFFGGTVGGRPDVYKSERLLKDPIRRVFLEAMETAGRPWISNHTVSCILHVVHDPQSARASSTTSHSPVIFSRRSGGQGLAQACASG